MAANPKTPIRTLRRLSREKDRFIRSEVAKNPSSFGTRFYKKLLKDSAPIVRLGGVLNLKRSYEEVEGVIDREGLLREVGDDILHIFPIQDHSRLSDSSALRRVAVLLEGVNDLQNLHHSLRSASAFSPYTSVEMLEKLYETTYGSDEMTRFHLAMNPSTPEYILEDFIGRVEEYLHPALVRNPEIPSRLLFKLHDLGLPNLNTLIDEHPKYTFKNFVEEFVEV